MPNSSAAVAGLLASVSYALCVKRKIHDVTMVMIMMMIMTMKMKMTTTMITAMTITITIMIPTVRQTLANKSDVYLTYQLRIVFVIEHSLAERNIVLKKTEERTKYKNFLYALRVQAIPPSS